MKEEAETTELIQKPTVRELESQSVRDAYKKIASLVLTKQKFKEYESFFDNLECYEGDDEFYTTLNFVMDRFGSDECPFITACDVGLGVDDLLFFVEGDLKKSYNISLDFPDENEFDIEEHGEDVGYVTIDHILRQNGFQLSFIGTSGDEFVYVLHRIESLSEIREAIKEIGYEPAEVKDYFYMDDLHPMFKK